MTDNLAINRGAYNQAWLNGCAYHDCLLMMGMFGGRGEQGRAEAQVQAEKFAAMRDLQGHARDLYVAQAAKFLTSGVNA